MTDDYAELVDIPTMRDMSTQEYRDYIKSYLLIVDHHGVYRINGVHPIAVTDEQFQIYSDVLASLESRIGDDM